MGLINHGADSIGTIVLKMSQGNPGAVQVILDLLKEDSFVLVLCDSLGIFGVNLYMLWNDCCSRDTKKMRRVFNAWLMKKITADRIYEHIKGDGVRGKPFDNKELETIEQEMTREMVEEIAEYLKP